MEWSANRTRGILDAVPDGIILIDREHTVVFANRVMLAFCNALSAEDVIGKKCHELSHRCSTPCPDSCVADLVCPHLEVFNGKKPVSVRHRHILPDGSERTFDISASPLLDDHGAVSLLIEVLRDVTEHQRAEESLRRWAHIFEHAEWGVATCSADGRTIDRMNPAFARMRGFTVNELVDRPVLDLFAPDARGAAEECDRLLREHGHHVFESRHLRKDGSVFPVLLDVTAVKDDAGTMLYRVVNTQDITERKKAENFTRNILESMGEGLIVVDRDYRILTANRAYCRQVNRSLADIIGRPCHEISHHFATPCFEQGEECAVQLTFRTGTPHAAIHTHYDKDDNPVYVELKSYPMFDAAGGLTSVIEVIHDITEKRRLEAQLRHAQKMEAVGTLTGGIAHDFNNILTAIIGYGGLLRMKLPDADPLVDDVRNILASAERAAGLTRSLLAFSRKQTITPAPADLSDVVRGVEHLLSRVIREHIELTTRLADDPLPVLVDRGQLEQVLINLATNASDAMPSGGSLTIATGSVFPEQDGIRLCDVTLAGPHAFLSVTDTGSGMDERTREKIFEPFFTTKDVGKGTGLGLAVAHGIVRQHNGGISVASEVGRGTTFRIYLPLMDSAGEAASTQDSAPALRRGTETVLLAEDDTTVRSIMTTMLREAGYDVVAAADGAEAVRLFGEHRGRIRLLLFDVTMPKMSGLAAREEIRQILPEIRTIFISGYNEILEHPAVAVDAHTRFLSKPVSPPDLLAVVREVLDS